MKANVKVLDNPNSEVFKTIYNQIEDTCIKIMETHDIFREITIQSIIDFVYPQAKTSTRTINVVKSVGVLAYKF